MTCKKLLYIGACVALAVLLVGVVLYFVTWTTDVEINNWRIVRADGFDLFSQDIRLRLRRHNYILRPAEYEVLAYESGVTVASELSLPEGCRAVSQHDDPSYVITQGYSRSYELNTISELYFAFSMENGVFIASGNNTNYLIGYADRSQKPAQILDYFSDFIENGCMPPLPDDSVINLNDTEASLNILNWAVVTPDGELVETPQMKLRLRVQDYLSENPELDVLSFYVPQDSRYVFRLYDGNPVGIHNPNSKYRVYKGFSSDRDSGDGGSCQYYLSVENGYILTKVAETGNYLIGSAKADYDVKEILKFFSKYTGK